MARKVKLKVKELALAAGLSEWDLAARSGLDVRVIRRMLANQDVSQMKMSQLARIAEALGVPTASLFVEPGT
jgi:transcriptional regulator with XRE-family HTH domain